MKTNRLLWIPDHRGETIAQFGQARLIRHADGRHELLGGTAADHSDARDWCSLFAPEVVFAVTAAPRPFAAAAPAHRLCRFRRWSLISPCKSSV